MIVEFDDDLSGEATRVANRLHGLLPQIHPSLERVLGPQLQHPAVLALLEQFGSPDPQMLATAAEAPLLHDRITDIVKAEVVLHHAST